MTVMKRKVLWVDDEIELLKAHIIFLEKRGYELTPLTNGHDAIAAIRKETFDVVLLDEMMPGIDGLSVLEEIKTIDPGLPVVMITKSEEEQIMDNALGGRISDYLTKPVNPSQIFTTLKRLFDTSHLRSEHISRDYARQAAQNRMALMSGMDHEGWAAFHENLCRWDLEIEEYNDAGLQQLHRDQKNEARQEFCKYVERNYRSWVTGDGPLLSHRFLDACVLPLLKQRRKVYFVVIDCFRFDHWLAIEKKLETMFNIHRGHYYSMLPTATPFSRNALFAGRLPIDIARQYPDIWKNAGHGEQGLNRYERNLLEEYLSRNGVRLDKELVFEKVVKTDDASALFKRLHLYAEHPFVTIVYNFIDLLSHQRSENDMLMEIAPDEAAFRSLTRAWFDHSVLFDMFSYIANEDATVVVTTDHGSIMTEKPSIVRGDRTTSTNIRYKYGRNLKCIDTEVFKVDNPAEYGLPSLGPGTDYLFAKQEYYLVYQNNYRQYEKLYQHTFQHGGISMEEMILPVGILTPR